MSCNFVQNRINNYHFLKTSVITDYIDIMYFIAVV